jgi:hypothetical protein
MGQAETVAMVGEIVERLRAQIGDKLGGSPAS